VSTRLPSLYAGLDSLRHAALLFAPDGRLLHANLAAAGLLTTDLHMLRAEGWSAATALFAPENGTGRTLSDIRQQALSSSRPIPFYTLRSGEYVPCSASALVSEQGELHMLLVLDDVDWGVVGSVLNTFTREMQETVTATFGHITLVNRTLEAPQMEPAAAKMARRITGFGTLIAMHMRRAQRLMTLMERLERLRTGVTRQTLLHTAQALPLHEFMQDFMHALDETDLLDPETDKHDYRGRLKVAVAHELIVTAHRATLAAALHEILRNAIMYSMRGTPVTVTALRRASQVQIDITDEGYGIRP